MLQKIFILYVVALLLFTSTQVGYARGHSYSHSYSTYSNHSHSYRARSVLSYRSHRIDYVTGVPRDSHGRIKRSEHSKREFMKQSGYPHGRKGYVVDHIVPLKRGGSDTPSNMQWQTKESARQKDKWE